MRFDNLPAWLSWQETLHFTDVDPGLERISQVWQTLNQGKPLPFKVVTVAGTNGKGSSVSMLESILRQAGYTTGKYTSPHILKYNERICINGQTCSDQQICWAFEQIDQARGEVSLTYFEFATLAAALIFQQQQIDIALFEVGMGGRLDAVNLFDADICLITPVSLDHTNWLGNDRETIAKEKAGVIRQAKPVVCSEQPAKSLLAHANKLSAPIFIAGKEFDYQVFTDKWSWQSSESSYPNLSKPALTGDYQCQNAAAVLKVLELLADDLPVSRTAIELGLQQVKLAGRYQICHIEGICHILDVTHNQQGAVNLANLLTEQQIDGRTIAVLAMLKDKDVTAVIKPLSEHVQLWYLAGLDGDRGLAATALAEQAKDHIEADRLRVNETVSDAYQAVLNEVTEQDRLLIFGSFHTVEAMINLQPKILE
jgi:dihydrofolate synthase/folylpolyglutamate synthase